MRRSGRHLSGGVKRDGAPAGTVLRSSGARAIIRVMRPGDAFTVRAAHVFVAMGLFTGALAGCDGGGGGSGGSAGGSGGTGGGGGAPACDVPGEVPSTQKLVVEIQNPTAEPRYALTECFECDILQVEKKSDLDYVALPLRVTHGQACGCECPAPQDPYVAALHRIAPGESFTATWDARTLATCTYDQDCGEGSTVSVTGGALQPAAPGEYRVSFGVIVNLPAECAEDGATGDFTCGEPAVMGIDPGGGFYPVEITLPASGDVSGTIVLP